ncbi:MAG: AAA family ATPase [Bacteroidia bacterium]|nr:AAA family ATPase [Bacteroidia bacterium]
MIEFIEIKGYKSIKNMRLELQPINILIGSNGAGKTNFISFFKLIKALYNQQLRRLVIEEGVDNLLYFGRKITQRLEGKLIFSKDERYNNAYKFILAQTREGGLFFEKEGSGYKVSIDDDESGYQYYDSHQESIIRDSDATRDSFLRGYLSGVQVFHFHDTTETSPMRKNCEIEDNHYLKSDGRNLPAILYLIKENHPKTYKRIVKTVQSVAPYFQDFILQPSRIKGKQTYIELRWKEKSDVDSNFSAYQLSDGTLRFIALTTLLLQPTLPGIIIIDEPELGLHPQAITKLAGMLQIASEESQIIVATQSVNLVDCFEPEDVIAVDRDAKENQSVFNRLQSDQLNLWLGDHSLGELWTRNIIDSAQPFAK